MNISKMASVDVANQLPVAVWPPYWNFTADLDWTDGRDRIGYLSQDKPAVLTSFRASLDCRIRPCDEPFKLVRPSHFASAHQISFESDHWRPSYDVMLIFKMADVSHVVFHVHQSGPPTMYRWWYEFRHQILDWSDVWFWRYFNF